MIAEASKIDWSLGSNVGIEKQWLAFHNSLVTLENRFIPMKRAANTLRSPQWIDKELRNRLNSRRRAWQRFKASCTHEDYSSYQRIRNACKKLLRSKRIKFERSLLNSANSEPKRIFSYINRRLKKVDDLPPLKTSTNQLLEGNVDRANLLVSHFSSVFNQGSRAHSTTTASDDITTLPRIECNEHQVLTLLKLLDAQKAPGPDGHHPFILKTLAPIINKPLTVLFNTSLETGMLPEVWKKATIKPMFKSGDKHLVQNYRPISLTSVLVKVLEKIVKKAIIDYLTTNRLLSPVQHGFTKNRSCITNLILAREDWCRIRNQRGRADAVFNPEKSQLLLIGGNTPISSYTLGSVDIPAVTTVRDLGIMVRGNLKTSDHTAKARKGGLRMLWALKRSFKDWSTIAASRLFRTFVRPILEYGAPAYYPSTKSECYMLEKVQRLATRMISQLKGIPYEERCSRLNLFTLEYRRSRADLIMVFKIVCLKQHPELQHLFTLSKTHSTRGHIFKLEKPRLDNLQAVLQFSARTINLWNSLHSSTVMSASVQLFKKEIDNQLWYSTDFWSSPAVSGAFYPRST
jgi:hypothetical protein